IDAGGGARGDRGLCLQSGPTAGRASRADRCRRRGSASTSRGNVTEYLDLDDLLAAAEAALGGRPEVRDVGLLQAAAARPQATAFGEEAYSTLDAKAAALLQSIVAGHPLVDGNKRPGWVAVRPF